MPPRDPAPSPRIAALASRIRASLVKKGWTQQQLENAAGFAQGGLSRILSGRQQNVRPATVHRIAIALGVRPEELAEGVILIHDGTSNAEVGPALSDVPGYANAEVQVAQREPHIPVEVFEEARKTRLASPPPTVTLEFLHAHICFLAEHVFHVGKASGARDKSSGRKSTLRDAKKSRSA